MMAFANSSALHDGTFARNAAAAVGTTLTFAVLTAGSAHAQRIENQVAVFAALDKVTARISKFEVKLGETVKFGALKVTPRNCFSRPATEQPKTTTFVEVNEIELDGSEKPLFKGWMFAESPGLNAVEHPVYDVWLTECGQPRIAAPTPVSGRPGAGTAARGAAQGGQPAPSGAQPPPAAGNPDDAPTPRRRPPR